MTVAHCIEDGGPAIALDRGRRLYGKGHRHPLYPKQDIDFAVVILDQPRPLGPYAHFATTFVHAGERVDMFGQGCVEIDGSSSGDGTMHRGVSQVESFSGADAVLALAGGAVACTGDSGGPVFRRIEQGEGRELVGLVSKGDLSDRTYALLLSSLPVREFLQVFMDQHVKICGLNDPCPWVPLSVLHQFRLPWLSSPW